MIQKVLAKWTASNSAALIVLSVLVLPALCAGQGVDRPRSDELLPESTVCYLQIDNVRELGTKLRETNMGKLAADERVAPLIGNLYGIAEEMYGGVEEQVGLSLDEIQALPAGEVCIAVIAPRRKDPVYLLIIDTDSESETLNKAIQRGRDVAGDFGVEFESEETDEVTFESFFVDGQRFSFFRKNGTFVIGSSRDELDAIIDRWEGRPVDKVQPLKSNRKFITIMNRCRGSKDLPSDFRFFIDPIEWAKSATRGDAGTQIALNMLPILGVDGLLGIGGSVILDEMNFDSVGHFHLLLSNPRSGILEMFALKPGTYKPQDWVPSDLVSYTSTSWDVEKMFVELQTIYDTFNGEGALQEAIEDELNDEIGIDLKVDLIDKLSGRLTFMQWVDNETTSTFVNSQTNMFAIGVKDIDAARETLDKLLNFIKEQAGEEVFESLEHEGVTYWQLNGETWGDQDRRMQERRARRRERGRPPEVEFRLPQPSFTLIDNHFILAFETPNAIKAAIETALGGRESLVDNERFDTVTSEMTKLLGTDLPAAVTFNQPSESIRWFLRLAKSDGTTGLLEEMAEESDFARLIFDTMQDNPLPEFEEIERFFPPTGGFVTNDDTGYHFLLFTMKAEDDE